VDLKVACGVVAFLLLFGLVLTCKDQSQPTKAPNVDGMKTIDEFYAEIKSYPFEAPQARRDKVINNYHNLEVGMPKEQVASILGEPDYSRLDYGPKGPGAKWLGSHWTYQLYKRSSSVNIYDPSILIFFGTDDRAKWIVPSAIEGLTEKGSPTH